MPFGTYTAVRRPPKKKPEEPPKPPKPKEPPKPPVSPETPVPPKPPEPPKPPVTPETEPVIDSTKIHVLIVGRNLKIISEFLCSMNENLGEEMHREGLAFFTRELEAISNIVDTKKRLEQFFWNFCQENWTYDAEEEGEGNFTFSISPSGNQSSTLDLVFHRQTPQVAADMDASSADAVWLLTDGLLLTEEYAADSYTMYLKNILGNLPDSEKKPVCLIPTQIEGLGRFAGAGSMTALSKKAEKNLMHLINLHFADACEETAQVHVIPTQVYGGMECVGEDENGMPKLHISASGYYQRYVPDHCHIPALWTMESVCVQRGTDFFGGQMAVGGLLAGIHSIYGRKLGRTAWKPAVVKKEEGMV